MFSSSSASAAGAGPGPGDNNDDDEMKSELDSPLGSDSELGGGHHRRRRPRRVFRVPGEWGQPIPRELLLREIGLPSRKRKLCHSNNNKSSLPTTADFKLTNKELGKTVSN